MREKHFQQRKSQAFQEAWLQLRWGLPHSYRFWLIAAGTFSFGIVCLVTMHCSISANLSEIRRLSHQSFCSSNSTTTKTTPRLVNEYPLYSSYRIINTLCKETTRSPCDLIDQLKFRQAP